MEDLRLRERRLANNLNNSVERKLILTKAHKLKLKSAVGIILCDNHILLGLAEADDERDGKWCFPGGGIDGDEDVMSAAVRESYEEMGVSTIPISQVIIVHPAKPMVGFVFLTCSEMSETEHNCEFKECKWFPVNQLPEDMLSINKDILKLLIK